jgi:ubiquinone/menaquinone biosynthesis C-methylase UbiE
MEDNRMVKLSFCTSEKKVKNYFKDIDPGWWDPKDTYPLIDTLAYKGKRILEVGAGKGRFTIKFLQYGASSVVATDISKNMLKIVRDKALVSRSERTLSLVQADAENLPFSQSHFDIGFCVAVFSHLVHPDRAISEISRTLKPNSEAILDSECDTPVAHFSAHRNIFQKAIWFFYHTSLLTTYRLLGSSLYWKFNNRFLRVFTDAWYPYQREQICQFAKNSGLTVSRIQYSKERIGYIMILRNKTG